MRLSNHNLKRMSGSLEVPNQGVKMQLCPMDIFLSSSSLDHYHLRLLLQADSQAEEGKVECISGGMS